MSSRDSSAVSNDIDFILGGHLKVPIRGEHGQRGGVANCKAELPVTKVVF